MDLSIVIPTLNRHLSLEKTLLSIVEQRQAEESYEVIVVDNGSADETANVCKNFKKQITNFVYCYDAEPGQLTGRHRGTELAKGTVISFIDDDVELNPFWINAVIKLFNADSSVSIIGGPCLPRYECYPQSWVSYFWQPTPYGGSMCLPLSLIDIGADTREIDPLYIFGLNYSIRKKTLLELGGFHPDCIPAHLQRFQGDGETGLSIKAKDHNIKALYSTSALLYHRVPAERLTPEYFEKWFYYSGVCQSFTDIRAGNKLPPSGISSACGEDGLKKLISKTEKVLRRAIINKSNKLPESVSKLQSAFNNKYQEGYQFHQHSFNSDASVKNWVLKADYWNYKLPV